MLVVLLLAFVPSVGINEGIVMMWMDVDDGVSLTRRNDDEIKKVDYVLGRCDGSRTFDFFDMSGTHKNVLTFFR
jgi:hypothetical protein